MATMPRKPMPRPQMKDWFKYRIDWHLYGMASAGTHPGLPRGVKRIAGDVVDPVITVTMEDNTTYDWHAGQYSRRKVNGCYAPLMPIAVAPTKRSL